MTKGLFHEEPGWVGAFTRNHAAGAYPNGTRVRKANSELGDGHADGTGGVVLGSMSHPAVMDGMICYFVEWDPRPRVAVACMETKLELEN